MSTDLCEYAGFIIPIKMFVAGVNKSDKKLAAKIQRLMRSEEGGDDLNRLIFQEVLPSFGIDLDPDCAGDTRVSRPKQVSEVLHLGEDVAGNSMDANEWYLTLHPGDADEKAIGLISKFLGLTLLKESRWQYLSY